MEKLKKLSEIIADINKEYDNAEAEKKAQNNEKILNRKATDERKTTKPILNTTQKTEEEFLKEVKKIFPLADLESIKLHKTLMKLDFCWCYGEISKNNYPDKYHNQIDKINAMARCLK